MASGSVRNRLTWWRSYPQSREPKPMACQLNPLGMASSPRRSTCETSGKSRWKPPSNRPARRVPHSAQLPQKQCKSQGNLGKQHAELDVKMEVVHGGLVKSHTTHFGKARVPYAGMYPVSQRFNPEEHGSDRQRDSECFGVGAEDRERRYRRRWRKHETDARSHSSRTRAWFQRRSETRRRTGAAGRGVHGAKPQASRSCSRTPDARTKKSLGPGELQGLRSSETWEGSRTRVNRALMKLTTGEAREVDGSVRDEDGFQAWRKLRMRFEPATQGIVFAEFSGMIRKEATTPSELVTTMTSMDKKIRMVEELIPLQDGHSPISILHQESVLVGIMEQ